MKITTKQLLKLGACADQVALFKTTFGKSVVVTEAICIEHAAKFNWDWAAGHLLPAPAWAEHSRVAAAAWDEYRRVTARALDKYNRVRATAFGRFVEGL